MTDFNVASRAELLTALSRAQSGDNILLASGDYGSLVISNKRYGSNISIVSSTKHGAHFDNITISGSSGIEISGIDVGRPLVDGEIAAGVNFGRVQDSQHIHITKSRFHGSLDRDYANDGCGLYARNVHDLQVTNSEFNNLFKGAFIQRSTGVLVRSNSFEDLRLDGLNLAAVQNAVLDSNSFKNFQWMAGDHPDAIQFWNTNESTGSKNVVISNNVILQGSGKGVQGIFIAAPGALHFEDFRIENNLLYGNDLWNGIMVEGGRRVSILDNTVLSRSDDREEMWIRLENSTGVTIQRNIVDSFRLLQSSGYYARDNIDISKHSDSKALFPNMDAPGSLLDLVVAGVGYQPQDRLRLPSSDQDVNVVPQLQNLEDLPHRAGPISPPYLSQIPTAVCELPGINTSYFQALP